MKLIATDMDGTLLRSDRTISAYTLDVLRRAHKAGAEIVIATGRMNAGITQYLCYMPFCRYTINTNGAEIYDCKTGKVIYSRPIEYKMALAIADYAKKNNIHLHIYAENTLYTSALDDKSIAYKKATGVMGTLIEDKMEDFLREHTVAKMVFMDSAENCDIYFEEITQLLGKEASVAQSSANFVEITSCRATKRQALEFLIDFMQISPDEAIAFGDSGNDIPMLAGPWHTRAVANAWEQAKELADKTVESSDDDGVAKEISRIFNFEEDKK